MQLHVWFMFPQISAPISKNIKRENGNEVFLAKYEE